MLVEMDRAARYVKNEALFRSLNDEARDIGTALTTRAPGDADPYLCECVDAQCLERITLTYGEYGRLRTNPLWFAVLPGHEQLEVERVVERNERYSLVEKTEREDIALGTARASTRP